MKRLSRNWLPCPSILFLLKLVRLRFMLISFGLKKIFLWNNKDAEFSSFCKFDWNIWFYLFSIYFLVRYHGGRNFVFWPAWSWQPIVGFVFQQYGDHHDRVYGHYSHLMLPSFWWVCSFQFNFQKLFFLYVSLIGYVSLK